MNVLYDNQIFINQNYGGISRYFFELMSLFEKDKDVSLKLPIVYTSNNYLLESEIFYTRWFLNDKVFPGKTTLIKYSNSLYAKLSLLKRDFDVFHPTYYDPYFTKFIGNKPFVITVYDMIHELYPESFPLDNFTIKWKKETIGKASRIIAISENTKRDLVSLYGIDEKLINVIHLASSLKIINASPVPFPLPEKYLLFVGQRGGYKNFKLFVEAFSSFSQRESDVSIVCVGGGSFNAEEIELFKKLQIVDRIIQSSVADNVLATLYANALAFVFPSLYEGFGIPILEAFNCGCPAVLGNSGSLPEVGGDAALYFDPTDVVSIRCTLEQVIQDQELRKNLIEKGFERSKEFTWEKVARQTKEVYAAVCNS